MIRGELRSFRPHSLIITHIFLGSLVEWNYRAELVHKRSHAKCLVTSVHRNAPKDMGNDDLIVRAGAVWSGVGTLAVALRGIVAPCSLWTLNCPEFLPFNLYLATNVHVMLR